METLEPVTLNMEGDLRVPQVLVVRLGKGLKKDKGGVTGPLHQVEGARDPSLLIVLRG